jgi:hypothetical protein
MIKRIVPGLFPPCLLLSLAMTLVGCSDDGPVPLKDASVAATVDAGVDAPSPGGPDLKPDEGTACQNGCEVGPPSLDTFPLDTVDHGDSAADAAGDSGPGQDAAPVDAPVDAPAGGPDGSIDTAGGADVSPEQFAAICKRVCDIVDMVTCPDVAPCLPPCMRAAERKCASLDYALKVCQAGTKASDWFCDQGDIVLNHGLCTAEIAAVQACFRSM